MRIVEEYTYTSETSPGVRAGGNCTVTAITTSDGMADHTAAVLAYALAASGIFLPAPGGIITGRTMDGWLQQTGRIDYDNGNTAASVRGDLTDGGHHGGERLVRVIDAVVASAKACGNDVVSVYVRPDSLNMKPRYMNMGGVKIYDKYVTETSGDDLFKPLCDVFMRSSGFGLLLEDLPQDAVARFIADTAMRKLGGEVFAVSKEIKVKGTGRAVQNVFFMRIPLLANLPAETHPYASNDRVFDYDYMPDGKPVTRVITTGMINGNDRFVVRIFMIVSADTTSTVLDATVTSIASFTPDLAPEAVDETAATVAKVTGLASDKSLDIINKTIRECRKKCARLSKKNKKR